MCGGAGEAGHGTGEGHYRCIFVVIGIFDSPASVGRSSLLAPGCTGGRFDLGGRSEDRVGRVGSWVAKHGSPALAIHRGCMMNC